MELLTDEETIEAYAQGPQRLQEALIDLTEQDLELACAPGEWTIRQLVHHIVDGDDLWIHAAKAALENSGCQYRHDWYTPDNAAAETLDYAGRAIEPALLLFQANHEHILQLVRHLPDALSRFMFFAWPGQPAEPITVKQILSMQTWHANGHCDDILSIRRTSRHT
jgi:DinB superfamily